MTERKINIAVIGLGFGASFAEIYQHHPDVSEVGICDSNPERLAALSEADFPKRHTSFESVLQSGEYDAVHVCLPATMHVEPSIQALRAGMHVACAVPMAMALDDLRGVLKAQKDSGRNYMMMETVVYSWEFFLVKEWYRKGTLGNIQFMRGAHYHDLENFGPVWEGQPPMWYMTHAVSPLLKLLGATMSHVACLGSGRMREDLRSAYNNPYPVETAIFRVRDSDVAAEITCTRRETACQYKETFDIYGDRATFLWSQFYLGKHFLMTLDPVTEKMGRECRIETIEPQYPLDRLPPSLRPFGKGHHGGSHPHLAHEFVRSIIEQRKPAIDATTAANWCAPGICAHQSAMDGGQLVEIPFFE